MPASSTTRLRPDQPNHRPGCRQPEPDATPRTRWYHWLQHLLLEVRVVDHAESARRRRIARRRLIVAHVAKQIAVLVGLVRIGDERAVVDAIRHSVAIRVGVGHAAPAHTRRGLARISRAAVVAVRRPVVIGVNIGRAAAANTGTGLQRILRTPVNTIRRPVLVQIGIDDAATAGTRSRLVRIVRASVVAVRRPVIIAIIIWNPAPALPRIGLVRIVRTAIDAIRRPILVRI